VSSLAAKLGLAFLALAAATAVVALSMHRVARKRDLYELELRVHCERARSSAERHVRRLQPLLNRQNERAKAVLDEIIEEARTQDRWQRRCAGPGLPAFPGGASAEELTRHLQLVASQIRDDASVARGVHTP
jgi:hypothetical protein